MIHGYGGSYMHYCNMLKALMQEFHQVYAIDLPGMGFSSKENINIKTPKHAIDFFINTIEEWRK